MPKTSNLLTTCGPETSSMVPSIDSKHDIIWASKQMALNPQEITDSLSRYLVDLMPQTALQNIKKTFWNAWWICHSSSLVFALNFSSRYGDISRILKNFDIANIIF